MKAVENSKMRGPLLSERLTTSGLRLTRQREQVYRVLLQKRDHPTADEVFLRAKRQMPDISLATVYNCLDALVQCGLVRHVHPGRGGSRFCPNMREHCHFYCEVCGGVFDIDWPADHGGVPMPKGFEAKRYEIAIRGVCPDCGARPGHGAPPG